MSSGLLLLAFTSLFGCPTISEKDDTSETGLDTADTDTSLPTCSDGSSGAITGEDESTYVFVGPDGSDDTGDGTRAHPYASVTFAETSARGLGVFVLPGDYVENIVLSDASSTQLYGCAGESIISDANASAPTLLVSAAQNLEISGLNFINTGDDKPTIQIWSAATVTASELNVQGGLVGFLVNGTGTELTLSDSIISDINSVDYGYGVAVQQEAVADISNSTISSAYNIGILTDNAQTNLQNASISDIVPGSAKGTMGCGILAQNGSYLSVVDSTITNVGRAGIASLGSFELSIANTTISGVTDYSADGSEDARDLHSDGVVTTNAFNGKAFNPTYYIVNIDGLSVDGTERAGVVIEACTVNSLDNITSTNVGFEEENSAETPISTFVQGGAIIDSSVPGENYVSLDEASELTVW